MRDFKGKIEILGQRDGWFHSASATGYGLSWASSFQKLAWDQGQHEAPQPADNALYCPIRMTDIAVERCLEFQAGDVCSCEAGNLAGTYWTERSRGQAAREVPFEERFPVIPLERAFTIYGRGAIIGRRANVDYIRRVAGVAPSTARRIYNSSSASVPSLHGMPYSFPGSWHACIEQREATTRAKRISNLCG